MTFTVVVLAGAFLVAGGSAQVNSANSLEPTQLERFAARPAARIKWSELIGNLESKESRATVTALIVEEKSGKPRIMRGIRIDLAHIGPIPHCRWKYVAWTIMCRRANAAVYIEESRLKRVRNGVARGAAQLRPMKFISEYRAIGGGKVRTGLIVCGYQFSGINPAELANLLTGAIAHLRGAPV